jgi:hypothetical protein
MILVHPYGEARMKGFRRLVNEELCNNVSIVFTLCHDET